MFVPIRWNTECLERHFTGPKWGGWCDSKIDTETADLIEAWVSDAYRNQREGVPFKVNRDRMQHSQEAWIPDAGKSASGQTVYSTGVHILRELPVKLLQDRPIVHGGNFHFMCQNTSLFYTILR